MTTNHGHQMDAFRDWLLDRPLRDVPPVLIPAWMEAHGQLEDGSERQCERLLRWWRRWVRERVKDDG